MIDEWRCLADPSKGFDAAVLGCSYSSTMGESIQLTDTSGCVLRPDLITRFYKMKESSNPQSDLTLYTYFKVSSQNLIQFITKYIIKAHY